MPIGNRLARLRGQPPASTWRPSLASHAHAHMHMHAYAHQCRSETGALRARQLTQDSSASTIAGAFIKPDWLFQNSHSADSWTPTTTTILGLPRPSPLFSAICDSFNRLGPPQRGRRPVESRFRPFSTPPLGPEGLAFPTENVDVTSGRLSKPIVCPGVAGVCDAAAPCPMRCQAWPRPSRVCQCRGGHPLCSTLARSYSRSR